MALPVHRGYDMALPSLPVIAQAEACAEKLARYRRTALGRDVYDLARMASRPIDEPLVRRLWVLKVWGDVVDDRRGDGPLDPADVLTERREQDFASESIGMLTQPVTWRAGNVPSGTGTASWLISTTASAAGRRAILAIAERSRPPWLPAVSRRTDQDGTRPCGLRHGLLVLLEGPQDRGSGLLDPLARRLDAGDRLVATTGPVGDVPERVVRGVETELAALHVGC